MRLLELKRSNIIVVYGGGFQPFHEGHASSYREAKSAFPGADFYVAASNVTSERPFQFKEKQFLAQQAGVTDPFVQVGTMSYVNDTGRKVTSTPLNPLEVLQRFSPEKDILVIIRSERDPMKTTATSYYQPWTGAQNAESFSKHAYIYVTKKHDFSIAGQPVYSGSQVRDLYAKADDNTKMKILQDLYPQSRQLKKIKQIFDKRLGISENLNEFAPDDGSDGSSEEDTLRKYASMWYNGNLATQQQVEKILARMGWEIGELESEEGGAFVIQSGDEHGDSYIGFAVADLSEASLSTMRKFFSGDREAKDSTKLAQMRDYYDKHDDAKGYPVGAMKKEFRSVHDYVQWLDKTHKKVSGVKK